MGRWRVATVLFLVAPLASSACGTILGFTDVPPALDDGGGLDAARLDATPVEGSSSIDATESGTSDAGPADVGADADAGDLDVDACADASCSCMSSNAGACGVSCTVCPSSQIAATCTSSACVVEYGPSWVGQTSPTCNQTAQTLGPGFLYAQQVSIPIAIIVTAFGAFGNSPVSGVSTAMSIYTSTGTGTSAAPSSPVGVYSFSAAFAKGRNVYPAGPATAIQPGTYWIVAQYQTTSNASVCADSVTTNYIQYMADTPYGALPPFATGSVLQTVPNTCNLGFFVVGTPQ